MGIPQIIMIMCLAFNLVDEAMKDGQPKMGTHNVGVTIVATGIEILILWAGGFFG